MAFPAAGIIPGVWPGYNDLLYLRCWKVCRTVEIYLAGDFTPRCRTCGVKCVCYSMHGSPLDEVHGKPLPLIFAINKAIHGCCPVANIGGHLSFRTGHSIGIFYLEKNLVYSLQ